MKKKLLLTMAISGSGKTWYIKNKLREDFSDIDKYLTENNLDISDLVVSPDDMRRELTGDVGNHEKDEEIWAVHVYNRTKEILKKHGYCIFDATSVAKRVSFLKWFENVDIIGLVFKPDLELSWKRISDDIMNGVDRSNVPLDELEMQYERFRNSVVYYKWDGLWDEKIKIKIKERLKKTEKIDIFFID